MKLISLATIALALAATLPTGCGRHAAKEQRSDSPSSARVLALDESNFDAEVRNGVVLVDFWAAWCGPCKMQAPIVEEVARRMEGKAKVAKLDIDTAPKTVERFGIRAIPTLIVFKNGKPEKQLVGLTKAETLIAAMTSALDSK